MCMRKCVCVLISDGNIVDTISDQWKQDVIKCDNLAQGYSYNVREQNQ